MTIEEIRSGWLLYLSSTGSWEAETDLTVDLSSQPVCFSSVRTWYKKDVIAAMFTALKISYICLLSNSIFLVYGDNLFIFKIFNHLYREQVYIYFNSSKMRFMYLSSKNTR